LKPFSQYIMHIGRLSQLVGLGLVLDLGDQLLVGRPLGSVRELPQAQMLQPNESFA
jgi:hypothetical protein